MTNDEINDRLDSVQCGDIVMVTRTNGGDLTATVTGPALAAPPDKAVGIDLLDGEPHVIRREDGQVFGVIVELWIEKVGR